MQEPRTENMLWVPRNVNPALAKVCLLVKHVQLKILSLAGQNPFCAREKLLLWAKIGLMLNDVTSSDARKEFWS